MEKVKKKINRDKIDLVLALFHVTTYPYKRTKTKPENEAGIRDIPKFSSFLKMKVLKIEIKN